MIDRTLITATQSKRKDVHGWREFKFSGCNHQKMTWGALCNHSRFDGNIDPRVECSILGKLMGLVVTTKFVEQLE
jgi:hypothetical protein